MNCFQRFVCAQCESARTACILSSTRLYLPVARRGEKAPFCSVRVADFFDFSTGICAAARASCKAFVCRKKKCKARRIIFIAYWALSFLLYFRYSTARANSLLRYFDGRFSPFLQSRRAEANGASERIFFAFPIRKISPNWRHNGTKHSFAEYYDKHNIIKTR